LTLLTFGYPSHHHFDLSVTSSNRAPRYVTSGENSTVKM